ncbi:uncharacterized protein A4U43_C04F11640 [Asparagus officinalis]|uniref:Uncharacterized protein n=1 Tax=Asparagus officinalis TaxID=4686 RepID=A0A5P1F036_ASPOF|nr:uncharacterized protein A4U43_C04F11640 [Asparagus officinalis]
MASGKLREASTRVEEAWTRSGKMRSRALTAPRGVNEGWGSFDGVSEASRGVDEGWGGFDGVEEAPRGVDEGREACLGKLGRGISFQWVGSLMSELDEYSSRLIDDRDLVINFALCRSMFSYSSMSLTSSSMGLALVHRRAGYLIN